MKVLRGLFILFILIIVFVHFGAQVSYPCALFYKASAHSMDVGIMAGRGLLNWPCPVFVDMLG